MLSLQQLTNPVTQPQAVQTILTTLGQLGFQATSWQSGSIQLTLINLAATIWSGVTGTISDIATGGFTTLQANLASAPYLNLLAQYVYDVTPLVATPTIGNMLLATSAGSGSVTFVAGSIIVADQPNSNGPTPNVFTVAVGGSMGPSSTLSVQFAANVAGSAANIPPGTPLYVWTGPAGVTVTNPLILPSNTWISTPGTDPESPARLATRCINKWAALTYGNIDGAYVYWAMTALPALNRASVASALGNCTVTLYGATAAGPLTGPQITTIENYVGGVTDGVGRRPINDIFTAVGSSVATTPALTITGYALSNVSATIGATITAALLNYFGTIPLGGVTLGATQGYVLYSQIHAICIGQIGVVAVELSVNADIPLLPGQIYTPPITVNVTAVAPS
jgi:hypothetical protein